MMKRLGCAACGRTLYNTEIALNLKLRGKASSRFFCLTDLGAQTDSTEEELLEMASFFRENGCALFSQEYVMERGDEQREHLAVDKGT